jgi:hypothetical protein
MATQGKFAKDQGVIDLDLKATARGGQQGQRIDIRAKLGQELVRQTDGARGVVSLRAIFNTQLHFVHL